MDTKKKQMYFSRIIIYGITYIIQYAALKKQERKTKSDPICTHKSLSN